MLNKILYVIAPVFVVKLVFLYLYVLKWKHHFNFLLSNFKFIDNLCLKLFHHSEITFHLKFLWFLRSYSNTRKCQSFLTFKELIRLIFYQRLSKIKVLITCGGPGSNPTSRVTIYLIKNSCYNFDKYLITEVAFSWLGVCVENKGVRNLQSCRHLHIYPGGTS